MPKASVLVGQLYKTVKDASLQAMLNTSDDIQSTSRDAVRRWKNRPDFGEELFVGFDRMEMTIKPKGNRTVLSIFKYVDKGTKPHIIMPRIAGHMLHFRTGYSAMTAPKGKYNVGSGQSFGDWVSKAAVNHPGNKPRDFMETFMNDLIPTFQQRVQQEITRAVA